MTTQKKSHYRRIILKFLCESHTERYLIKISVTAFALNKNKEKADQLYMESTISTVNIITPRKLSEFGEPVVDPMHHLLNKPYCISADRQLLYRDKIKKYRNINSGILN